jgi:hypothetical protein
VGIAAGAQLKTRRLRESEIAEAANVFGNTLPIDRILLTNLARGDRAFCVPHIDGSILIGMRGGDGVTDRFDNPLKHLEWRATLIHELTHAWQIQHMTTLVELFWEAAANEFRSDDPYAIPSSFDGRPWSKFGIEQQAKIVEMWYWTATQISPTLDSPLARNYWSFPYIQNNIRLGQT